MPTEKFTTVTPLPAGISRDIVLETLHDHLEMIDLNPTHYSRERVPPPPEATPEEYHCTWYRITDRISVFPGIKNTLSFYACFHDLQFGSQIHCYAPLSVDIKQKWTVGGNGPHEPIQPRELGIGAPVSGLYVREDIELRCNFFAARFVRKTLKEALSTLVARLVVKAQLLEAAESNRRLAAGESLGSPQLSPPSTAGLDSRFPRLSFRPNRFSQQTSLSEMDGTFRPNRFSQQTTLSEMDGRSSRRFLDQKSPKYSDGQPNNFPGHLCTPVELP